MNNLRQKCLRKGANWGFGFCIECAPQLRKLLSSGNVVRYADAAKHGKITCNWWNHTGVLFVSQRPDHYFWTFGSDNLPEECKLSNPSRRHLLRELKEWMK